MEILFSKNKVVAPLMLQWLMSRGEEALLIEFFGDEYVDYRKKVGVWIPFIS